MLRIPHCLDNGLTDGGKVVSTLRRSPSTPQKQFYASGTHFRYRLSKPPGPSADGRIRQINKNHSPQRISNPRPSGLHRNALTTTLPRAPYAVVYLPRILNPRETVVSSNGSANTFPRLRIHKRQWKNCWTCCFLRCPCYIRYSLRSEREVGNEFSAGFLVLGFRNDDACSSDTNPQQGTSVTVKNGVLWDVSPCDSCKNRRFGGT
jgi:hypothetical protein